MSTTGMVFGAVTTAVLLPVSIYSTMTASEPSSFFYGFPLILHNRFPVIQIVITGILSILYFVELMAIREADLMLHNGKKKVEEELDASWSLVGSLVFAYLVLATFAGNAFDTRMEKCGGLTINCIPNDISPSANALFVIGQVAIPFYTFASLFCLPVVAGLIAMFIPEFVAAATSMTAMHPASRAVTRTAKQHRPDHLIEEELWAIMRRQDVTDAQTERLFRELSPLRRFHTSGGIHQARQGGTAAA